MISKYLRIYGFNVMFLTTKQNMAKNMIKILPFGGYKFTNVLCKKRYM